MTTDHHHSNCECGKRTRPTIFIGVCLTSLIVYLLLSRDVITHKRSIKEKARISPETIRPTLERPTMVPQPLPPLKNGFRLIFPHVEPKLSPQEKKVNVVAIVISAAKGEQHRRSRETIRTTWGKSTKDIHQNQVLSWKMVFALAIADNKHDHEGNIKEAEQYNDIIMGNFTDTYRKLVWKTFMSYYWVNFRIDSEYILKADDDVYVRVPELITWLQSIGNPKPFYGGCISSDRSIFRNPNSPWYVSVEQYNATHYPPWCRGPFYVFSSMNIPKYLKYIHTREPFMTEDTYIAVISKELGIEATHIPGFSLFSPRPWTDEDLLSAIAYGHKLNSNNLVEIHRIYTNNKTQTK